MAALHSVEKKRLQFVDMMKGIAVLVIVFYHILAPGILKNISLGLVNGALFTFFFFSGYFYTPGRGTVWKNISKRAGAVMKPFFLYSLILWLASTVYHVAVKTESMMDALCCLRNFYAGCIWNRVIQQWFGWEYHSLGSRYLFLADFWFLLAMCFASILFVPAAERTAKSGRSMIITIAVLLIVTGILRSCGIMLVYNLQLVPFWTAIMLLGTAANRFGAFDTDKLREKHGAAWAATALAVGFCVSFHFRHGSNLFRGTFDAVEPLSMLMLFITGAMIVWGGAYLIRCLEEKGIKSRFLSYTGSHSIFLYLLHMFFAWVLSILTGFSIKYSADALTADVVHKSVLLALACIALSLAVSVIHDKWSAARARKQ